MPRARDIGSGLELRRGDVERMNNAQAQYFRVAGSIQVNGAGEAVGSVTFPVLFVDKPSLSFGHELGPGQPVTSGSFPTCTVAVSQWAENMRDDGTVIYSGATFNIRTTGPATQVMIVQWNVEGIALRGPVPTEE